MFWQGWWEEENTWERVARWFWVHCEQVQNSWRVFCSSWKLVWSWVHCQSLQWREARQVYQVIWMFNWDKLQPQVGKKEAFCEELEAQVAEMFAKCGRTNAGRRYKDFFLYIYYYPWGARRSTFWRYHNLNSVRHRKSTNHPSCTCTCSACSFNIGLALLLGIRSLDPRPRARTAPALAWCRRQLGSQTSCSAKSRSQYSVLNI